MTSPHPLGIVRHDLVPLADRMNYLRSYRAMAVVAVLGLWFGLPEQRSGSFAVLAAVTAGYLFFSVGADVVWRAMRRRGHLVFSAMLLADGLWLAVVAHSTGGPSSLARTLILCHLIVVSLLASFRTGVKIALWHSMLTFVAFHADEAGLLGEGADPTYGDHEYRGLVASAAILWIITLTTATYAACNERELRRRRYDLEALARLSEQHERASAPEEVGAAFVRAVTEDFGFDRAVLLALTPEGAEVLAQQNCAAPAVVVPALDERSLIEQVRREGQTRLLGRLRRRSDAWLNELLGDPVNLVALPLRAEARVVGVLVAEHGPRRGGRIEHRIVATLERFASQTALALANAWLLEQIRSLAARDTLTGLPNRRTFEETLGRDLARTTRTGLPLSLLVLDVDHFKAINDRHGHLAGDTVLVKVAKRLAEEVRQADLVARWGGEEFTIVLPEVGLAEAMETADRLRTAVADLRDPVAITCSIGVATFGVHGERAEALVEAADRALYAAKRTGRNRVVAASAAVHQA